MERALKLVSPPAEPAPPVVCVRASAAGVWGALLVGAALWASGLNGAGAPGWQAMAQRAEEVLPAALENGAQEPEVRAWLVETRTYLGAHPLDARVRALYAGVLLELARTPSETAVARFHALRAAATAPVTVPVVRAAAMVLARAGEAERALELDREMFRYEPRAAAVLLARLEPYAARGPGDDVAERTVPDLPGAWLAWARQCLERGRQAEADRWFESAWRRWPQEIEVRQAWALRLAGRERWDELAQVLPAEAELPLAEGAAALWALRARARAELGDREGARADAERAVELAGKRAWILLRAGDALLAAGQLDAARHVFNRARFTLPQGAGAERTRLALLVRLARLEDQRGRPADAMRAWREVLEQAPDHPEGRRRLAELRHLHR